MLAAIYARVSTERQERQQTITSQLAALRAWAEAEGHELNEEHVFHDEGFSGARLDRPGLDSLRDAVRDGAVTLVGVLAPDRLARKYAYQALLLEEFRRAGCTVAFLNHPISDDPGDQLLLQIQGAVAEYERALLSERFRRGKLQKARTGQLVGVHPPYGYRYLPRHDGVAGQMVVDATEAETVRMLYGWLTEERLTLRQILKHLNFGPWFPRCGRRPWSPSTVHHILSDSVYTGTAYANRYQYVAARKPRPRKPSYSGKGCRQLRPKEQWIPIPVPALIEAAVWDRAQAQLARNAVLSFRNNKKHDYLLRCLLTCGSCGLAMFGMTRPAAGNTWRRCYRCAGKDCIKTARSQPCPRASVNGEDLEQAVWSHVRELLGAPERLMAQFEHFVGDSDRSAARKTAAQRLAARLDGLARADARLLDAYQVEVISLEELTERRRQLAEQRRILDHQLEQERDLSRQQAKAQEVMADLTAFCHRVRDRLDKASFADKQAILQLIIERIIVHEDSLEIRHVIPLRSPPPGWNRPADEPNSRLRSDRVDDAGLDLGLREHGGDRVGEAFQAIHDRDEDVVDTTILQLGHHPQPELRPLGLLDPQPQDLLAAVGANAEGKVDRLVADRALVADLHPQRIEEHQGIDCLERPVLPLGDLVQDGVGHRADQVGRDVDAVEFRQMPLDLADRHTPRVHRHDLVVKAG
jgi:site-specific DNA recombinase